MKKYHDFSSEIKPKKLFKGLLGHGLFAEKIPPFLTSLPFCNYILGQTYPYSDGKPTDYIRYSNMRNINIPRPLAIPDPFSYANQVQVLAMNWDKIISHFKKHTSNQQFKVSRIHIRKLKDKDAIFEMTYKNFETDGNPEEKIFINSKYIANADIATCFPSIYSHSIPWSLIGKEDAKKRSGKPYANEWFNELDYYTRMLKYGETNGVLIGPHSSNLISELILCCVDYKLVEAGYKFYRNVDDYTCFTKSHEDAEKFFIDISEYLKQYELSLNSKKSKISQLPQASVTNWVTRLNHFNFKEKYVTSEGRVGVRLSELKGFLDFAVETMLDNQNDAAILNYAIKSLSDKHLGKVAHEYYLDKIHHLTLLYPYLTLLLEKKVFETHNVNKAKIESISNDLYELGIAKKNFEISSYAVYFSLKYNFKLTKEKNLKEDSIKSSDCIFLMIAYLYDSQHQNKKYLKEYKDLAVQLYTDDFHRYWLFCYEVLTQNELKDKYKSLKKGNVSFLLPKFYSMKKARK